MSETCFHCGDELTIKTIELDGLYFCCNGCSTVYTLLKDNDLNNFYSLEQNAGIKPKSSSKHKYAFLDVPEIKEKYILFKDGKHTHITLYLPQIHCSSCIYLLEQLNKIIPAVISSQVDFSGKLTTIVYKNELPLSELAFNLDKIGYAPRFGDRKTEESKINKTHIFKLGISGFAFGSIMLWTFPEYFGIQNDNPEFRWLPTLLSFLVSLPVLLYSANEYLISAWKAILNKSINLDVPIYIGIIALYSQSCFDIFSGNGPGYMDSFAGFIFFLLIGKWFQSKSYRALVFDRDYRSYFPIAITRIRENKSEIIEIDKIHIGDQLKIRNEEIIPCDSKLKSEYASIDYSFVTGESETIKVAKNDFIYAGGKINGASIEVEVLKESNRSHLTQLWNEHENKESIKNESDKFSIYFLIAVLIISLTAGIIWSYINPSIAIHIIVSILIVACPCALALSKPFTYGSIMRRLGRLGMYIKNTDVIDKINSSDTFIFDKTGTLTNTSNMEVNFIGSELSNEEINSILKITENSTHPLSLSINSYCQKSISEKMDIKVTSFKEIKGQGIIATINDSTFKIGSNELIKNAQKKSGVHLSVQDKYVGYFEIQSEFRHGVWSLIDQLSGLGNVIILSGDNSQDEERILKECSSISELKFNQTPGSKMDFIRELQKSGKKVMMIGDGLNDSGALKEASCGIAVSDNLFSFTPGSDGIIDGIHLTNLKQLIDISKFSKIVLNACFIFSICYNLIGLFFAVTGNLTPLIAAILMPLSSITIVLISTVLSNLKH